MTSDYVRRGFVHGPAGNIEYLEAGAGPALVLLHPAPASCTTFEDAIPLLAHRQRVIAMSQPGFGESDPPPRAFTSVREYALAVTWLLNGLGIERANVLGSLTSALTALELAVSWPERVDRLVLEECFNWSARGRLEALERRHGFEEKGDGSHLVAMWERQRERVVRATSDPAEIRRLTRRGLLDTARTERPGPDGVSGQDASTLALSGYPLWERAPLVIAPTLVVHGASSQLGGAHERLLEAIPNARGIRPPAPQSFTWRANPELWAAELLAFLAEQALS